eukprot:2550383-Alexandrium_andersonii.AAC.1
MPGPASSKPGPVSRDGCVASEPRAPPPGCNCREPGWRTARRWSPRGSRRSTSSRGRSAPSRSRSWPS